MNKKLLHFESADYTSPAVVELKVKAEAGFAFSDSALEDIPETEADGGF
ncbi:MAG: hypothetical protein J6C94_01070 [Alistipes sp.]|nr:hypothetical protein [Alistipes sp.]